MKVVEASQGNVVQQLKTGKLVNQYLSGCAGVKLVPLE
jgi:hypothetical protein